MVRSTCWASGSRVFFFFLFLYLREASCVTEPRTTFDLADFVADDVADWVEVTVALAGSALVCGSYLLNAAGNSTATKFAKSGGDSGPSPRDSGADRGPPQKPVGPDCAQNRHLRGGSGIHSEGESRRFRSTVFMSRKIVCRWAPVEANRRPSDHATNASDLQIRGAAAGSSAAA